MSIRHQPCVGWWEQGTLGQLPMNHLQLTIEAGSITGTGDDCVGNFSFAGFLSPDNVVRMDKQYVGRHSVDYRGKFDGHHQLYGEWWIGEFSGAWEITLLDARKAELADSSETAADRETDL